MVRQAKAKQAFPPTVHVYVSGEGADSYLVVADTDLSDVEDGRQVATYQLVAIGRLEVSRELV